MRPPLVPVKKVESTFLTVVVDGLIFGETRFKNKRRMIYRLPQNCFCSTYLFSFCLMHLFPQIMKTLIMLCLRDGSLFKKLIQERLLSQKQLMVLLFMGQGRPFCVFNRYAHSYLYSSSKPDRTCYIILNHFSNALPFIVHL